MVTDAIADHFFTTSTSANHNLTQAGIQANRIHFVGNTMIDTLLKNEVKLQQPTVWETAKLSKQNYFVLTLHRPTNVDDEFRLKELLNTIISGVNGLPIIFSVHPRTAKNLQEIGIESNNLFMIDPMPYLEFNYLVKYAKAVITDSGGITEETTVMGVPCFTLRDNTERPETVEIGTNELIGTDIKKLPVALEKLFDNKWKKGNIPPLWDGKTGKRIVDILNRLYN
jgi:UDP-N-acetylglucosamine 2-epimerase (non-hydrolysing)